MKISNQSFVAEVTSGVLEVVYRRGRTLKVTTFDNFLGKTMEQEVTYSDADSSEKKLIEGMNKMPVFCATYQGDGEWSCDIDAGFQRWIGNKTGRAVGAALRRCEFHDMSVSQLMREARKTVGAHCPRQW